MIQKNNLKNEKEKKIELKVQKNAKESALDEEKKSENRTGGKIHLNTHFNPFDRHFLFNSLPKKSHLKVSALKRSKFYAEVTNWDDLMFYYGELAAKVLIEWMAEKGHVVLEKEIVSGGTDSSFDSDNSSSDYKESAEFRLYKTEKDRNFEQESKIWEKNETDSTISQERNSEIYDENETTQKLQSKSGNSTNESTQNYSNAETQDERYFFAGNITDCSFDPQNLYRNEDFQNTTKSSLDFSNIHDCKDYEETKTREMTSEERREKKFVGSESLNKIYSFIEQSDTINNFEKHKSISATSSCVKSPDIYVGSNSNDKQFSETSFSNNSLDRKPNKNKKFIEIVKTYSHPLRYTTISPVLHRVSNLVLNQFRTLSKVGRRYAQEEMIYVGQCRVGYRHGLLQMFGFLEESENKKSDSSSAKKMSANKNTEEKTIKNVNLMTNSNKKMVLAAFKTLLKSLPDLNKIVYTTLNGECMGKNVINCIELVKLLEKTSGITDQILKGIKERNRQNGLCENKQAPNIGNFYTKISTNCTDLEILEILNFEIKLPIVKLKEIQKHAAKINQTDDSIDKECNPFETYSFKTISNCAETSHSNLETAEGIVSACISHLSSFCPFYPSKNDLFSLKTRIFIEQYSDYLSLVDEIGGTAFYENGKYFVKIADNRRKRCKNQLRNSLSSRMDDKNSFSTNKSKSWKTETFNRSKKSLYSSKKGNSDHKSGIFSLSSAQVTNHFSNSNLYQTDSQLGFTSNIYSNNESTRDSLSNYRSRSKSNGISGLHGHTFILNTAFDKSESQTLNEKLKLVRSTKSYKIVTNGMIDRLSEVLEQLRSEITKMCNELIFFDEKMAKNENKKVKKASKNHKKLINHEEFVKRFDKKAEKRLKSEIRPCKSIYYTKIPIRALIRLSQVLGEIDMVIAFGSRAQTCGGTLPIVGVEKLENSISTKIIGKKQPKVNKLRKNNPKNPRKTGLSSFEQNNSLDFESNSKGNRLRKSDLKSSKKISLEKTESEICQEITSGKAESNSVDLDKSTNLSKTSSILTALQTSGLESTDLLQSENLYVLVENEKVTGLSYFIPNGKDEIFALLSRNSSDYDEKEDFFGSKSTESSANSTQVPFAPKHTFTFYPIGHSLLNLYVSLHTALMGAPCDGNVCLKYASFIVANVNELKYLEKLNDNDKSERKAVKRSDTNSNPKENFEEQNVANEPNFYFKISPTHSVALLNEPKKTSELLSLYEKEKMRRTAKPISFFVSSSHRNLKKVLETERNVQVIENLKNDELNWLTDYLPKRIVNWCKKHFKNKLNLKKIIK